MLKLLPIQILTPNTYRVHECCVYIQMISNCNLVKSKSIVYVSIHSDRMNVQAEADYINVSVNKCDKLLFLGPAKQILSVVLCALQKTRIPKLMCVIMCLWVVRKKSAPAAKLVHQIIYRPRAPLVANRPLLLPRKKRFVCSESPVADHRAARFKTITSGSHAIKLDDKRTRCIRPAASCT